MEPNNQKTSPEPAFSNIPISSHTPQVISPTFNQAHPQPAPSVAESAELASSQSNPGPNATTEPASTLPMMPISKRSGGGRFSRFKNKKFILSGAAAVLVLVSAGIVFGWYIPNKPENVYRTGLDRTGEVTEKLILDSLDKESLEKIKKSELNGKVEATGKNINFSTDFSSTYDEKASDTSVNAKYKLSEENEKSIGIKFLTETLEGKYYPNIYFQLTGLSAFGLDQFAPGLSAYDGKWISATSEYLESVMPVSDEDGEKPEEFTHADAAELAKITISKTREYILTSDTDKSVIIQKSFVGTEKLEDGITANHYKIGLSKQNAKRYCSALLEAIYSTKAYKKLPFAVSGNADEDKKASIESCQESVNSGIKEEDTYDLWIDKKYKLIHKLRVSDKNDKNSYVEVGQKYKGGDEIPLFVNVHGDKDRYDGRFTLNLNSKTDTTKGTFSFDQQGDDWYKLSGWLEFKPFGGELKIEKPAGAVSIQEVLNNLGFGDLVSPGAVTEPSGGSGVTNGGSGVSSAIQDTERKKDINAMQSRLEEHYAVNGFYPSLSQFNSSAWRSTNMPDFDEAMLKDPAGPTSQLAAAPTVNQYSYSPSGCNGAGVECQSYTLAAKLSDGSSYTKSSLF